MQIKDVILSHVNLSHIDRGAGRTSHEKIVKEIEKNRQLEKEVGGELERKIYLRWINLETKLPYTQL